MSGFWNSETMRERLSELIEPFDGSRIASCSYELSMGDQAFVTRRDDNATKLSTKYGESEHVNILPGQFAQLLVKEYIRIPDDALGLISMKSKYKMSGLVNVSGFHVDPGYEGQLVFAVFNAGSAPIVIGSGESTFLIWYASLDHRTEDLYTGSRKGCRDITSDQLMNLKGPTYNPTALAERVSSLEERNTRWRNVVLAIAAGIALFVLEIVFDFIPTYSG